MPQNLRGEGHANARQPSEGELNAIYNDVVKAARNGNANLDTSDHRPYGGYWSSTPFRFHPDGARVQYFGDGYTYWDFKDHANALVRCVRDEPGLTLA